MIYLPVSSLCRAQLRAVDGQICSFVGRKNRICEVSEWGIATSFPRSSSTAARPILWKLGWKPKVRFQQLVKMMVDEDIKLTKTENVLVDAGYLDAQQQR